MWGTAGWRTQRVHTHTTRNHKKNKPKETNKTKRPGDAGETNQKANATHEEHKTASTANEQHPSTHTKTRHKATKHNEHTHTSKYRGLHGHEGHSMYNYIRLFKRYIMQHELTVCKTSVFDRNTKG